MNILQGKWTELKGEIQRNWSELTNDELDHTKGSIKAMTGLLEQKYGKLKRENQTKLQTIWNRFVPPTGMGIKKEVPITNPVAVSIANSSSNEEKPFYDDTPLVSMGPAKALKPRGKKTNGGSAKS